MKEEIKKQKVFTKKESNNIIKENHNPLKVNYKNLFEKDGLFMKETKEVILKKEEDILANKYKKNPQFIQLLKKICTDFKINNHKMEIEKFLEKN
ncbi:MAG: hypothetical protein HFJ59_02340 [Clostridia bacterium]|nr:hypothetical protein [Clostridia bacterium]